MDILNAQGKSLIQQHAASPQIQASSSPPKTEPFPTVAIKEYNPRYAQMLKVDMVSSQSELTAILQYLYQSWILTQYKPELAQTLHHFALDEMKHLNILGEMVTALGGNPSYSVAQQNRVMVWNGSMVSYAQAPLQMMQQNAAANRFVTERYKKQIAVISNENITAVLRRIVQDKETHQRFFEKYTMRG